MKKSILALLLAATVAPTLVACDGSDIKGLAPTASIEQVFNQGLPAGEATYQKAGTDDVLEFGFTAEDHGRQSMNLEFMVTWSDGYKTLYRFDADGGNGVYILDVKADGSLDYDNGNRAKVSWKGDTMVLTTEKGSVTQLGGFKTQFQQRADIATQATREYYAAERAAEQARQAEERRLNNETFDETISRMSEQVCRRAESLSYISTNTIVNQAVNPMLRNNEFKASQKFWNRWNGMNPHSPPPSI